MTQSIINIGTAPNDGTGDPTRSAFDKCNLNFTELYQVSRPTGNAIEYQFNNTTTEPPATGQIRFNNATQASTTKIWASQTTSSGVNIKQFLAVATTGAKLVLQDKIDNTNYIKFDVTGAPVDKTTYWEFAVAVTASGGNLPNAAILAAVTAAAAASGGLLAVQKFTTSGIYTPTAGMVNCVIECVGGGAGGHGVLGAVSYLYTCGGGGSGGYSRKYATATDIGASKPVVVGAGGAGGIYNMLGGVGSAGGDSSVGSLCIAKGAPQNASGTWYIGGAGAPAGTGDIIAAGASGGGGTNLIASAAIFVTPGNGGSSYFGGGADNQVWAPNASYLFGTAAKNYGGGGGGASTNNTSAGPSGGSGSAGIVIITEYK